MEQIIDLKMDVRISKITDISVIGYLGQSISDLKIDILVENFQNLKFETTVFDCPLFKTHKIISKSQEILEVDPSASSVKYLEV